MTVKTFELRDRATFVPVIAVKLDGGNAKDQWLLRRSGYQPGQTYVLMAGLAGGNDTITCAPYDWFSNSTRQTCHQYIIENFDQLESGAVLDAEFIRGETEKPKESEMTE